MFEDKTRALLKRNDPAATADEVQTTFAATVLLLRDAPLGMEVLMLRKTSNVAFGGMWVFPGGRIDEQDGAADASLESRARSAAVREAREETDLQVVEEDLHWLSHWTPPARVGRRFITWFYAARAPHDAVTIDHGEIRESRWLTPTAALQQHAAGEIELAPPTYVSLHRLTAHDRVDEALSAIARETPRHYATRIGTSDDDLVVMWKGDAGYESGEVDAEGPRHRLRMKRGGWIYEDDGADPG